jgi:DNA-binding transcriptional ArsR family regulator
MGGSDVRSQLDVVCAGKVRRQSEIMHAVGEQGALVPDMTTYGEGHSGVWAIVEDSGDYEVGRSFNLCELPDLRRIAYERRDHDRHLAPALAERLGDLYTELRAMQVAEFHSGESGTEPAVMYGSPGDALDRELEEALPDDLRDKARKIDATNEDTRRILAEGIDMPDIPADVRAQFNAARWKQVAAATDIPPDARERLLVLLAGEGTTAGKAADALGVKPWTMRKWLERLREDGLARVEGVKRGARWKLAEQPPDSEAGDAP